MNANILKNCFCDTINLTKNEPLSTETYRAKASSCVYKAGFVSNRKVQNNVNGNVAVVSGTTFAVAKRFCEFGKTAVLNFANPEIPGGGVVNGAMAQEECLCRSSNLYPCLNDDRVFDDFYLYHRHLHNGFYSERLIYTKDVTVFKDDSVVPQLMPQNEWFKVDIITCAAPFTAKLRYVNSCVLRDIFKSRIKNIFEAALENGVEVLVLGAFGCGAFKNPPRIVAHAFKEVINDNEYQKKFKNIVFAIKSTVNDDPFTACPNIAAFEIEFYGISSEVCKEGFSGGTPVAYAYGDVVMPSGKILKAGDEFLEYYEWKSNNQYFEKQFSIFGDSISTLSGYNPKGYKVFYDGENCEKSEVKEMKDTWWGKVIDFFGGELLVNNSWSGSRVTKIPQSSRLFPSGCSAERTSALHINNVRPDVIIIYIGTNDWAQGVETNYVDFLVDELTPRAYEFLSSYQCMINNIKDNYPNAQIWCCTLCSTYMSENPSFKFPYSYRGVHIEEYNNIIRDVAHRNKCKIVDLYAYNMPYDSIDGTHPNVSGMSALATMVVKTIGGKEVQKFLDDDKIDIQFLDIYKRKMECDQSGIGVGTVIDGKYELLKLVGKGAFTQVYLALDLRLNKQWAVKIQQFDLAGNYHIDRKKLMQKAEILKHLNHPAIPNVVDVLETMGSLIIVQDYIEGVTLDNVVENYGAQPAENVVEWAKQLCSFLGYIHSLNPMLIYRGMKPSNVMLQIDGKLKVISFGIMRSYKINQMADTNQLGTKGYAAPEQYCARQTDTRTDIYGLGMTMLRLATGIDPAKQSYSNISFSEINKNLPKGLEYIINKCIESNPDKRYQNCNELLADLNDYTKLPHKRVFKNIFKKGK